MNDRMVIMQDGEVEEVGIKDFNILVELIEQEIERDVERLRVKGYKYIDDTRRYYKIIKWIQKHQRASIDEVNN